jgi:hypothetical protein
MKKKAEGKNENRHRRGEYATLAKKLPRPNVRPLLPGRGAARSGLKEVEVTPDIR